MVGVLGVAVRELRVGKFGKACVWMNEAVGASFQGSDVARHSVLAGTLVVSGHIAIEAMIPRGARSEYGLLGIAVVPNGHDKVQLAVPWLAPLGPQWRSPLVASSETAYVGLPKDYAQAVLGGLIGAVEGNLGPCLLNVLEAAHGLVGSSPNFMAKLAKAAVEIVVLKKPSDDQIADVVARLLLA